MKLRKVLECSSTVLLGLLVMACNKKPIPVICLELKLHVQVRFESVIPSDWFHKLLHTLESIYTFALKCN